MQSNTRIKECQKTYVNGTLTFLAFDLSRPVELLHTFLPDVVKCLWYETCQQLAADRCKGLSKGRHPCMRYLQSYVDTALLPRISKKPNLIA